LGGSIAATVLVLPALVASAAHADGNVPFTDEYVQGSLTFCDAKNNEVTSGTLDARPFVVKAVSSAPAPAGYNTDGSLATLYIFQPRKEVDPLDWSGKQLTASSYFSNPKHPMTKGIPADISIKGFAQVAPLWGGFAEVRMYFTAVNASPHADPYPAAVIHISGKKWTLVSGGGTPCDVGTTESRASQFLSPEQLNAIANPKAPSSAGAKPSAGASPTSSSSPQSSSASSDEPSSAATPSEGVDGAAIAAANTEAASASQSGVPSWLALLVLPVLGLLGAGIYMLRQRSNAPAGAHARTGTSNPTNESDGKGSS